MNINGLAITISPAPNSSNSGITLGLNGGNVPSSSGPTSGSGSSGAGTPTSDISDLYSGFPGLP